jgi:hypothetical protein
MNVYVIKTKGTDGKMSTYKYKNDRRRHRVADGEAAAIQYITYQWSKSI